MKGTELRDHLSTILFSAFAVIAVFFLLRPMITDTTETLVINTQKIYINLGWVKGYGVTLFITFVLMVLFMNKHQIWSLIIGLLVGSLPLLKQYQIPGVARVMNVFGQSAALNVQTVIPYLAIILGALLVLVLLKIANRIFK